MNGVAVYEHSGGQHGTSTFIMLAPERNSGIAALINMDEVDAPGLETDLMKILLGYEAVANFRSHLAVCPFRQCGMAVPGQAASAVARERPDGKHVVGVVAGLPAKWPPRRRRDAHPQEANRIWMPVTMAKLLFRSRRSRWRANVPRR